MVDHHLAGGGIQRFNRNIDIHFTPGDAGLEVSLELFLQKPINARNPRGKLIIPVVDRLDLHRDIMTVDERLRAAVPCHTSDHAFHHFSSIRLFLQKSSLLLWTQSRVSYRLFYRFSPTLSTESANFAVLQAGELIFGIYTGCLLRKAERPPDTSGGLVFHCDQTGWTLFSISTFLSMWYFSLRRCSKNLTATWPNWA